MKQIGFLLQRVNEQFLQKYFNSEEYKEYQTGKSDNYFSNKEIYQKIIDLEKYLKEKDFELFNFVGNNIISFESSFEKHQENILKIYDMFFSYHQNISDMFFHYIIQFEKIIKNKVINSINYTHIDSFYILIRNISTNLTPKDDFKKRLDTVINIFFSLNSENILKKLQENVDNKELNRLSKNLKDFDEYFKKLDSKQKHFFDYRLINEFSFSDIINLFETLKNVKYRDYVNLRFLFKELLGDEKYNEIYHSNKDKNISLWFLTNFKNVRKLRNKVMHNKLLFSNVEELNKGIDSLINLSYQYKNLGQKMYNKLIIETIKMLELIDQSKAYTFFLREILNFGIKK